MEITASLVKELRERTGAGMMECKKALVENAGDIDAAAEWLRKSGLAKADKKADRVAAEGRIATAQAGGKAGGKAVLVEVNSETDFVAKDENFLAFTETVATAALNSDAADAEALKSVKLDSGETIEERRAAVIAKVGENLQVRRLVRIDSANNVAAYVHGGRIGVLVELKGGDIELARGIAMHIAAMNPPHVKASDVPAEFVAKEKEIELAKMSEKDKAKPAEILEKIISGKISKIVNEVTLYGQPYVLNTDQTVEQAVKAAGAEVVGFQRLAVGEGIEKVVEDYAAEVMKQAGLA
ncbi:translation elongation factor Ts [Xanthomonas arboricola]|uniref:translation elongation factor Ts n=1 Tax=Xanthomonas arboricola TaxID=56448 RepID=UPI00404093B0